MKKDRQMVAIAIDRTMILFNSKEEIDELIHDLKELRREAFGEEFSESDDEEELQEEEHDDVEEFFREILKRTLKGRKN